jgi:carboxylate-amine ligase
MLSDGPAAKAWFEHRTISEWLDIPVVRTSELESRGGRLIARADGARIDVDVLYNRSGDESLRRDDGRLSPLGELLVDPLKRGSLACVNSFGSGIADDKAVHCYVDEMIPFYLGEEPLLDSVPGFDLGEPSSQNEALDRLDELVVKPRWSFGGQGLFFGPSSSAAELDEIRSRLELNPSDYVAQPIVSFSVHPTAADDRLEPRHVDLRAFVVSAGGHSSTLPIALTRFAGETGEMVVNSTRGGGAKDTWLPETNPDPRERTP